MARTSSAPYALVVDDHPLVARGIAHYLLTHCGFESAPIAADDAECMQHIASHGAPAIAVVDFWLSDDAAVGLLEQLSACCPAARLLVVSGDNAATTQGKARTAGAHGFLQKSEKPEVFAKAVKALVAGGTWFPSPADTDLNASLSAPTRPLSVSAPELGLTQRQGEVLALVLRGMPNKQIARTLELSEQTVKEHVTSILGKLGVSNRVQAIALLQGRRLEA